jgi:exonuclease SbcD
VQDTYTADGHEKTLLKLKLSGRLPEEDYSKLPQFREALNKRLAYLQIDDTEMTVKITADVIEREFTQGSFPYQLLSSLVSGNETETLQEAYDIIRKVRS